MNARDRGVAPIAKADIRARLAPVDWGELEKELDARGCAVIKQVLTSAECDAMTALYATEDRFRSRVVMERHGFGRGEYKYFAYPLPPLVAELRTALYPHLAPIANRWNAALDSDVRYPAAFNASATSRSLLPCAANWNARNNPGYVSGSGMGTADIRAPV